VLALLARHTALKGTKNAQRHRTTFFVTVYALNLLKPN
jgi:hypothetical protein